MIDTDKPKFMQLVLALFVSRREQATEALLQSWWVLLRDLPIEQVERGIFTAGRKCTYPPTVADVRTYGGELSVQDRARIAWDAVREAIRAIGGYRSVCFDDRAVNASLRSLGGWPRVCSLTTDELDKWTPKDFAVAYAAYHTAGVTPEAGAALPGGWAQSSGSVDPKLLEPMQLKSGLTGPMASAALGTNQSGRMIAGGAR